MPKIIKDRQIVDDHYQLITEGDLPAAPAYVSLDYFTQNQELVLSHAFPKGVLLKPDQSPELLGDAIHRLDLIALDFPAFADGRGYSHAWILRNRLSFKGELRATGDVFKDTLFYLSRCGFDSYAVRADKDLEEALQGLSVFSESYQAGIDQPLPLFRRRLSA